MIVCFCFCVIHVVGKEIYEKKKKSITAKLVHPEGPRLEGACSWCWSVALARVHLVDYAKPNFRPTLFLSPTLNQLSWMNNFFEKKMEAYESYSGFQLSRIYFLLLVVFVHLLYTEIFSKFSLLVSCFFQRFQLFSCIMVTHCHIHP